jgi:hypothetical protein
MERTKQKQKKSVRFKRTEFQGNGISFHLHSLTRDKSERPLLQTLPRQVDASIDRRAQDRRTMVAVPAAEHSVYAFSVPLHVTELTVRATVPCYFRPWQLQRSNSLTIDIWIIRRVSRQDVAH